MTFKEMAPFVIVCTLFIGIFIAIRIDKKGILTRDGKLSVLGFGLGLVITFLNVIYSNNYMITLGPILAISSIIYLRFRNKILLNLMNIDFNFDNIALKFIKIMYWIFILIALISYQSSVDRPLIFFISISFGVALVGLEILSSRFKDNFKIFGIVTKILLISLILRSSAYFASPFPIGVDPWGHAVLIKDISFIGSLKLPHTRDAEYYTNYPLMHIYAVFINLIENVDIKISMFIIGVVLTLSTVFVYLVVKNVTGNINLALLAMLMLNFADFHIQWSIEVIAMSFGIAIYTILLYLITMRDEKHQILITSFLIMFFFTIIWTHTISAFIELISIISLYIGSLIYRLIEYKNIREPLFKITFCLVFMILLLYHWMDPNYPFLDSISIGMANSLSAETRFLGRSSSIIDISDQESWKNILGIVGFLIYIFLGIIGVLYCSAKKYTNKVMISLVAMLIVLLFIFFAFPVLGLRNIVPYRWPAFIYVSLVLFASIGLMTFSFILKDKYTRVVFIISMLFISSFFMITNSFTDKDSPIYTKSNQNFIFSESEMKLFENINKKFDGQIIGDSQSIRIVFWTYLRRNQTEDYLSNNDIKFEYMNNKLILWRERFVYADKKIKNYIDNNFSNIYDTGDTEAYLKTFMR